MYESSKFIKKIKPWINCLLKAIKSKRVGNLSTFAQEIRSGVLHDQSFHGECQITPHSHG